MWDRMIFMEWYSKDGDFNLGCRPGLFACFFIGATNVLGATQGRSAHMPSLIRLGGRPTLWPTGSWVAVF